MRLGAWFPGWPAGADLEHYDWPLGYGDLASTSRAMTLLDLQKLCTAEARPTNAETLNTCA
jgi:hypothetical protein